MIPMLSDPVGQLAIAFPGASRVFYRHHIDYCCGGTRTLHDACVAAATDPQRILAELTIEAREPSIAHGLADVSLTQLIDHILVRYHQPLKAELPRLRSMTAKVAAVHGALHPELKEVNAIFTQFAEETDIHLQKEETILFPWICAGAGTSSGAPIACLRDEHDHHGENLRRLRDLCHDYNAPDDACGTWRALYLGLADLERELMEHISLENNLLFPRALSQ